MLDRSRAIALALSLGLSLAAATPAAAEDGAAPGRGRMHGRSGIVRWWHGTGLVIPQTDLHDVLREHGVVFSGSYVGALFGIRESAGGAASPWDQGAQMRLDVAPDRLLGEPPLDGLVITAQGRWRQEGASADPNSVIGGNAMFDPTNWASGTGWRLLQLEATYTTRAGSDLADRLWLRAGWVQPRYEFALQPMTDRILNNAVNSAKGIGGNIPFSSSFSTWGVMARLRGEATYAKAGLFMAYPDATAADNHGVAFAGGGTRNSVMGMAELAWTPRVRGVSPGDPSDVALPGKYVVGGYVYDDSDDAATAGSSDNFGTQGGAYLQADQLVSCECHGAGGDEPQGLTAFGFAMLAPAHNSQFQLYSHLGVNYTGLVPRRDRDATIVAAAYGNYSRSTHDETIFVEAGYHAAVSGWLDVYPFVQYEVRPAGDSSVANAVIVGFATKVVF